MRFGRVPEATLMQEKALALFEALDMLPALDQGTDPLTALSLLAAREQLATGNLPAPRVVGETLARSAIVGAGFLGIGSAASLYGQN